MNHCLSLLKIPQGGERLVIFTSRPYRHGDGDDSLCRCFALVDLSFHPSIGFYGCCATGSGQRSSTQWYCSNPQPWSSGIAKASGSIGVGDHAVWDGPGSAQKCVI